MHLSRIALAPLAAIAFVLLAAAAADAETEPNNDSSTALPIEVGVEQWGDCADPPDFFGINLTAENMYLVSYNLMGPFRGGRFYVYAPNGSTIVDTWGLQSAAFGFNSSEAARYFVAVECDYGTTAYTIDVSDSGPIPVPPHIAGPDETEPNDLPASGEVVTQAGQVEGALVNGTDNVDYWKVHGEGGQGVRVTVLAANASAARVGLADGAGHPSGPTGSVLEGAIPLGGEFTFAAFPMAAGGDYTLNIEILASSTELSEGGSEQEPNNAIAQATSIDGNVTGTYDGRLRPGLDGVDLFIFTAGGDFTVGAKLIAPAPCSYSCPLLTIRKPNGQELVDPYGDSINGTNVTFAATNGSRWIVQVTYPNADVNYSFRLSFTASRYADGQVVNVTEVIGAPGFSVFFGGSLSNCVGIGRKINFFMCGDGTMYGGAVVLSVDNEGPVDIKIRIPAGLRLDPDDSDYSWYVVTRDQQVDAPSWAHSHTNITAASEGPATYAPDILTFYDPAGNATGNLARIINRTATGAYSPRTECMAIWVGASGQTRQDLKDWGANDNDIKAAGDLLRDANVSTEITSAPIVNTPPPPNLGTSSTSPSSGPNPLLIVGGILFLLIAVGAVARRSAAKKRAAAAFHMPPAAQPYSGVAPAQRGTYSTFGPTPQAPPPSAPYAPAAPSYVAPAPPRAPTPPAAAPAAPITASFAAPPPAASPFAGEMSNCPQCNAVIAIGTPKCAACGLDIAWN